MYNDPYVIGPSAEKSRSLRDCFLLVFICAIIYIPLLGTPVWDGNEPMRVIAAKEMLRTGNWIMPMLHGRPYFAKPPLMNWLIAASVRLFGVVNEWTSRLPSVLLILMTSISVYLLTKKWLGRDARLFAGVMLMSMTGLIANGKNSGNRQPAGLDYLSGTAGLDKRILQQMASGCPVGLALSLAGIGFLSKGPQIIIFFYVTVVPYLLIRKRISFIFSWAHVFGVVLLLLILMGYVLSILHWTTLDQYLKCMGRRGHAKD